MKTTTLFFIALIAGIPYAQSGTDLVDRDDLPPIQKEKSVLIKGQGGQALAPVSAKWDSLEQNLLTNLSADEKERYMRMKEQLIAHRALWETKRDSVSKLSPEKRKQAVEMIQKEILSQLSVIEYQIQNRLTEEQKNARMMHRQEIEQKRLEITRQMEEVKRRIQERLNP